jgi:hypothetical protein
MLYQPSILTLQKVVLAGPLDASCSISKSHHSAFQDVDGNSLFSKPVVMC